MTQLHNKTSISSIVASPTQARKTRQKSALCVSWVPGELITPVGTDACTIQPTYNHVDLHGKVFKQIHEYSMGRGSTLLCELL